MKNIRPFGDKMPQVTDAAWIDPTAVVIGDVHLGKDSSLWPHVTVRGDIHSIRIGARTNIQDGSVIHVTHDSEFNPGGHPVVIGDDVTVGHNVTLHGCRIESNCLIGMGAIIMDGVAVNSDSIIAAGSLVPPKAHLDGGKLWMGNPARPIRNLSDKEIEYLHYLSANYIGLATRYRGHQ